ncbi:cell division control protein 45 homolog [Galendromus occidentalis]|uniref:Cell division control protein 45 homolog n=1 Tax=Galendromus occidentalis TaxID=34638 RepID=A0AAJ7L8K1_9ACAR|nr:cell division control protein 45 homolog [Galendromus occidentalis]
MFVQDLKTEFYDVLVNQRVLVLCGADVDALVSCKILQYLFQCDNILYTLVPVTRKQDITEALEKHGETGRYVVLLNCGGTFDILEDCKPENENLVFFIADAHRPFNVYNVYNNSQVRILSPTENENIPGFEDVFRDDMDSDAEEEEEEGRDLDEILERKRQKRAWIENRNRLLFDYTQFNYFGKATSLTMFELCWKMSRDSTVILWYAIIGLSDQLVHRRIESDKYVTECGLLQGHMTRHDQLYDQNSSESNVNSLKLSFDKELNLIFLKHWTLLESMRHTQHFACRFKMWTVRGQKKIYEFLAELGVPLSQCKQIFASMDITFRSSIKEWIFKLADKYSLDEIGAFCFSANLGYKHKFNALDVATAVNTILDQGDFFKALDALSWSRIEILEKGIEASKTKLISIFQQVQTFLETRQIASTGRYLYAVLQESTPNSKLFGKPGALEDLAHFLQAAYVARKSRDSPLFPMVVAAPSVTFPGYSLVIGIPPQAETSSRNLFAQVFNQAAVHCSSAIQKDAYLQENLILVQSEHSRQFFEAIYDLLCSVDGRD